MTQRTPPGPQRLSLVERVFGPARVPYSVRCLIVAMAAGGPGSFLLFYLGGFDLGDALTRTTSASVVSVYGSNIQGPSFVGVAEIGVFTLALFVDMYLTRYLRLKVLDAGPKLSSVTPASEGLYGRDFELMSSKLGPLLVALAFFLLYFPARASIAGGTIPLLGILVLTTIDMVIYGTAFWVYLSGLWGVYRFGLRPLALRRVYEDRMLGLRPLGQLVVTFAVIFTGAITLTLGSSLITGEVDALAVNLVIVALGVAMLFLPLVNVHRKMVEAKEAEEYALNSRAKELLLIDGSQAAANPVPLSKLDELVGLQRFLALKEDLSKMTTWPFESRSVERLVAVLLAISTVLLARFLELVA